LTTHIQETKLMAFLQLYGFCKFHAASICHFAKIVSSIYSVSVAGLTNAIWLHIFK